MSLTLSGPFAAFLELHLQDDGTWTLVLTAQPPATGVYDLTITEAVAGYSNSPHQTLLQVTVIKDPPIDADGALASWPADLTVIVPIDPDGAALLSLPLDPGDRVRIKVDMSARSFGRAIDTVEYLDFDEASKALGWRVGVGDDREKLDKTNRAAAVFVECDPALQQSSAFSGAGVLVMPTIRFRFTNGEAAEASFPFQARQL